MTLQEAINEIERRKHTERRQREEERQQSFAFMRELQKFQQNNTGARLISSGGGVIRLVDDSRGESIVLGAWEPAEDGEIVYRPEKAGTELRTADQDKAMLHMASIISDWLERGRDEFYRWSGE